MNFSFDAVEHSAVSLFHLQKQVKQILLQEIPSHISDRVLSQQLLRNLNIKLDSLTKFLLR